VAGLKPRLRLDELLLEAELTQQKYLVVEGPTDASFFRTWLATIAKRSVTVSSIDDVDVPTGEVFCLGLNDGNRSRVIAVAAASRGRSVDIRCVADTDCGHGVDKHNYEALLWTDYPGLESYALTLETLGVVCELHAGGRLPAVDILLPELARILREIFAVRCHHEHLPKPNYRAGFTTRPPRLDSFDVALTVDYYIRADIATYARSTSADPRRYAYGHDIAEVLFAVYANELKNGAGIANPKALETALLSALLIGDEYACEPLFDSLSRWAA
jgi:hypothetical protein